MAPHRPANRPTPTHPRHPTNPHRRDSAPTASTGAGLRRRSLMIGGLGLAVAGVAAACAGQSPATSTTTAGGATPAATTPTAPEPISPTYHEPAASNTALSAGTWSGAIGDKEVTLKGAYIVDGVTATLDGGTWESTTADQAVFLVVNGGSLTLTNAAVVKSGDATSNGNTGVDDSYNFYGLNSAVVVVGAGSSVSLNETTLETTSSGSNAVVATGTATATVTACAVSTSGESSRGLHATYEGVITASDLSINTLGAHCAAVATDRGNGTVTVEGTNTFTTAGDGSPLIYSTGAITVSGLTGSATGAEAVVVEGKNQAAVSDSTLTTGSRRAGIMLYQSMSGDAADADAAAQASTLPLTGVSLTCTDPVPLLYVTNTTSQATLTDCTLNTSGALASADEDRWGTSGSNGGTLALTLDATTSDGAITAGSTSSITVTAINGGGATGTTSGSVTVS